MKLIKRGAEAVLYKTKYLGQPVLFKQRIPKQYRHVLLDEKIRKLRTKQEAILLDKAKQSGVRTPVLLKVDKKNAGLWMEWIKGKQLKEELNIEKELRRGKRGKKNSVGKFGKQLQKFGQMAAQLHAAGIIHGDLTTSNVLVNEKEWVLLDFGLGFFSEKTEDRAVDLLNLKKTFQATHPDTPDGFERMVQAYARYFSDAPAVFGQIKKIENRIRYA